MRKDERQFCEGTEMLGKTDNELAGFNGFQPPVSRSRVWPHSTNESRWEL